MGVVIVSNAIPFFVIVISVITRHPAANALEISIWMGVINVLNAKKTVNSGKGTMMVLGNVWIVRQKFKIVSNVPELKPNVICAPRDIFSNRNNKTV